MSHPATVRSPTWPAREPSAAAPPAPRAAPSAVEAACFEAHPDAQLILDAECAVIAANRAARRLLALAQGPRALAEFLVGAGELLHDVRAQVATAIRSQLPSEELTLPVSASLSFALRVIPLGAAHERALLLVHRREAVAARCARERFRFTHAESHVADHLSRGLTVPQIAVQLGISVETVRCHLKQAYAKAGVHRQAELVAVMLGR